MSKKTDFSTILIIIILLSIIIFSPQITDFFKGMTAITGRSTQNFSPNISLGNIAPTIPEGNISKFTTPTVIAGGKRLGSFTYSACDKNGLTDLVGFANMTGADDDGNLYNHNLSCVLTGWTNTTCQQVNCSFDIWYWYKTGEWNFSINATDGTEWVHSNSSADRINFNLASSTGLTISPSSLSWASLSLDDTNKTSITDPIFINNTANDNISYSQVNITGHDLVGESVAGRGEYIPANNFTAQIQTGDTCSGAACIECFNDTANGTKVVNKTSMNIVGSMLPRGNFSAYDNVTGQETIFLCLRHVPEQSLSQQAYSTQYGTQWVIEIV